MSDDFLGDWQFLGLAGALSEELAAEEKERRRAEKELEQEEDCPCCSKDCDDFDPPDEDPCP